MQVIAAVRELRPHNKENKYLLEAMHNKNLLQKKGS